MCFIYCSFRVVQLDNFFVFLLYTSVQPLFKKNNNNAYQNAVQPHQTCLLASCHFVLFCFALFSKLYFWKNVKGKLPIDLRRSCIYYSYWNGLKNKTLQALSLCNNVFDHQIIHSKLMRWGIKVCFSFQMTSCGWGIQRLHSS